MEQRRLWDIKVNESIAKMKAEGVTTITDVDNAEFFKLTQPVRDKYGAQFAELIKRIQATKY